MNDLCTAIGQAYGNYYKQLPRIHVKGRHIDLISEHYSIEIINCDDHYTTFLDAIYNDKIEKKVFTSLKDLTNPRSQGCPRFQSGEELANSVGKINAYYSL